MFRMANMVHLLPASQSHHHRRIGGLLRHSLEVGLYAIQLDEEKFPPSVSNSHDGGCGDPRWKFAVFLAGIGHDLGKIYTDVSVFDRSEELKWCPVSSSLYEWANRNGIDHYLFRWQENRGKNHLSVSGTLMQGVIHKDSWNWLCEEGMDEVCWIYESLNANPGTSNEIHQFVVAADQMSVRNDLKLFGQRDTESKNSSAVLQHAGSTTEKQPTFRASRPIVLQCNSGTTQVQEKRKAAYEDVLQHYASARGASRHGGHETGSLQLNVPESKL